jgi:hypothetical protein
MFLFSPFSFNCPIFSFVRLCFSSTADVVVVFLDALYSLSLMSINNRRNPFFHSFPFRCSTLNGWMDAYMDEYGLDGLHTWDWMDGCIRGIGWMHTWDWMDA